MFGALMLFLTIGGVLTPETQQRIATTPPGSLVAVNVRLVAQADPRELLQEVRALPRAARRARVVQRLKDLARQTQPPVLRFLESHGARDIRSLWIVNLIHARVAVRDLPALARLPEVARVDLDESRNLLLEQEKPRPAPATLQRRALPDQTGTREIVWGVSKIRAPEVWNQGYRGQGVVVAVLDTGVNLNHQDLADHPWVNSDEVPGNGVDDDNNGFVDDIHGWDFVNNDNDPMDDHGHGTHCAGTVAGDGTAGSQTGVAPEARIMAVKVLDSQGSGTESGVWQAIQYAVDNGADVISMSLGWQHAWNPDRPAWRQAFENVLAAGVVAAVAAGNERDGGDPAPDNIRTPGDVPPPWFHPDQTLHGGQAAVVTVGATTSDDSYAYFSSYGPVTWQDVSPYNDYPYNPGMGLMDPDVAAPGYDIKSLDYSNNSGYTLMSGTSMATPHVAGVMALLLSRNPELTPAEIDEILETSAVDLGPTGKDNDYGAGRVDAYEAFLQVPVADLDARPEWILAPRGQVAVDVALAPRAVVVNAGRENAAFWTVFEIDSAGHTVYQQSLWCDTLAPGQKDTLTFPLWVPRARGTYLARVITQLTDDEMPANDTLVQSFTARPMGTEYLVWDLDPNHSSGPVVDSLLMELGYTGRYSMNPNMADSLRQFRSVWLFVGMYPDNYVVGEGTAVADSLEAYIQSGKPAYLEGGDVWYYDPTQSGHDFGPTFGIDGTDDGTGDLSTVEGVAGTFTEGHSWSYGGENNYVDHLAATGTGFEILRNPSAGYTCGIANDAGTYRTVGLSFELGGLQDGTSTRRDLVQEIATFFGLSSGPPTPTLDAAALEVLAPRGTVFLGDTTRPRARFQNQGTDTLASYWAVLEIFRDAVRMYRDSVLLEQVPPGREDTVAFQPFVPDIGTYQVQALSRLRTDENPSNDTATATFTVPDTTPSVRYLVWDLDPNHSSGPRIHALLDSLGLQSTYSTSLAYADSLAGFHAVFVCAGIFSQNHRFYPDSAETQALNAYISNGGRVYLEGGDVWYYDPSQGAYDFGPTFGIEATADGSGDLGRIQGVAGSFAEGLSYRYVGENNWIDHLSPTDGAFALLENQSPNYVCAVARDAGTYRTVGASFELGGLAADGFPVATLLQRILNFFDAEVPDPALAVAPPELQVLLPPDRSWSTRLWIQNTGEPGSRLFFRVADNELSRRQWLRLRTEDPRQRRRYPSLEPAKGARDPRPGLLGAGGPDAFGYTWADSHDSLGPDFFFVDLTGPGTPLNLGDEDYADQSLPWPFPFYGNTYSTVRISSNGYLTFGTDGTDYSNDPIPDTTEPNNLIAVLWDDLNPSNGGEVYTWYDADNDRMIVEWYQVPRYGETNSALTFEAVLYPDGRMVFLYQHLLGTLNSATVGIENEDASDGLPVVYNADYLEDSLAVAVYPPTAAPGWLFENPLSGYAPAGGAAAVTLTLETGGMSPGEEHQALVFVYSNAPAQPVDTVAVTLQVADTLQGDVNGDGIVSQRDREILEAYLYYHGPAPSPLENADVNQDGQVDDRDLALLNLLLMQPEGKALRPAQRGISPRR